MTRYRSVAHHGFLYKRENRLRFSLIVDIKESWTCPQDVDALDVFLPRN